MKNKISVDWSKINEISKKQHNHLMKNDAGYKERFEKYVKSFLEKIDLLALEKLG